MSDQGNKTPIVDPKPVVVTPEPGNVADVAAPKAPVAVVEPAVVEPAKVV